MNQVKIDAIVTHLLSEVIFAAQGVSSQESFTPELPCAKFARHQDKCDCPNSVTLYT